jgi:hypothetical protein
VSNNHKEDRISFEAAVKEVSLILFDSFLKYSVKPTVARLFSMKAARKTVHKAGTEAFARLSFDDPATDMAYADV